jgi:hypothetical protein
VLFSAYVLEEPVQNGAKPRSPMRRSLVHIDAAALAALVAVAGALTVGPVWGAIAAQSRLVRSR